VWATLSPKKRMRMLCRDKYSVIFLRVKAATA